MGYAVSCNLPPEHEFDVDACSNHFPYCQPPSCFTPDNLNKLLFRITSMSKLLATAVATPLDTLVLLQEPTTL
jgi:hypothetical protein